MKKVEAFIRHEAFEPIRMELLTLGFPSLSIMEVKGSGRQKGITERYRGAELTNYLRPRSRSSAWSPRADVQTVVDTILKHARTGSIGDGKVFVLPVDEAYRIRTGESGEETLQAHPGAATGGRSGRVRPGSRRVRLPPRARSSSGFAASTSRWWTPCSAATGSAAWPSSPRTPPAPRRDRRPPPGGGGHEPRRQADLSVLRRTPASAREGAGRPASPRRCRSRRATR